MGEIIDKVKEKAKDVKDKVVDTSKDVADKTKDVAGKTKDTVSSSTSSSPSSQREYEEGAAGTETGRKDDPLVEYRRNEPMTPSKIIEHEPTAVKRDPADQKITQEGQTGTETEQANEQYRKKGMTKTGSNNS
jgi:hypothetical protein